MAEAISGVGLMFGPVFGAFLYSAFGYFFTFFAFGLIILLNLVVTYQVTPESLNHTEYAEEKIDDDKKPPKPVSFNMFLQNKRSMYAFVACVVVCISISY